MQDIDIEKIRNFALEEIDKIDSNANLEKFRLKYIGRKSGKLTIALRSIKDLSIEKRKKIGFLSNEFKKEIEVLIKEKQIRLKISSRCNIDFSKPYKKISHGELHPLTKTERLVRHIFLSLGFSSVSGFEVETEFNNFDALNIPKNHPAREMWDTLWLKNNIILKKRKREETQPLL